MPAGTVVACGISGSRPRPTSEDGARSRSVFFSSIRRRVKSRARRLPIRSGRVGARQLDHQGQKSRRTASRSASCGRRTAARRLSAWDSCARQRKRRAAGAGGPPEPHPARGARALGGSRASAGPGHGFPGRREAFIPVLRADRLRRESRSDGRHADPGRRRPGFGRRAHHLGRRVPGLDHAGTGGGLRAPDGALSLRGLSRRRARSAERKPLPLDWAVAFERTAPARRRCEIHRKRPTADAAIENGRRPTLQNSSKTADGRRRENSSENGRRCKIHRKRQTSRRTR